MKNPQFLIDALLFTSKNQKKKKFTKMKEKKRSFVNPIK